MHPGDKNKLTVETATAESPNYHKRADMHASLYSFTGSSFTITRNEEHK